MYESESGPFDQYHVRGKNIPSIALSHPSQKIFVDAINDRGDFLYVDMRTKRSDFNIEKPNPQFIRTLSLEEASKKIIFCKIAPIAQVYDTTRSSEISRGLYGFAIILASPEDLPVFLLQFSMSIHSYCESRRHCDKS